MRKYRVTWAVTVDAETPYLAAQKADAQAPFTRLYEVVEFQGDPDAAILIDLDEEEE